MSCCGGARPQRVRRQLLEPTKQAATAIQQRKISKQTAQPASIQRQYIVPRQQCTQCGYPTMTVTVAGRERHQCSNANCREIVR